MNLALISDIHANCPALEVVLADIDGRGDIGATHHLGDLVGGWELQSGSFTGTGCRRSPVNGALGLLGCSHSRDGRRDEPPRNAEDVERSSRGARCSDWNRRPCFQLFAAREHDELTGHHRHVRGDRADDREDSCLPREIGDVHRLLRRQGNHEVRQDE
jgi:hypothetical protein